MADEPGLLAQLQEAQRKAVEVGFAQAAKDAAELKEQVRELRTDLKEAVEKCNQQIQLLRDRLEKESRSQLKFRTQTIAYASVGSGIVMWLAPHVRALLGG